MSAKIYTGFAWDASNLPHVMERLKEVEARLKRMCTQRKAEELVEMAIWRIDKACMAVARGDADAPKGKVYSPVGDAFDEMRKRQKEILSSGYRDPSVDFEVKIAMWYVPAQNRFIGHVIAEDQGAAYKLLRRQPGVSNFQYWNNTDRPSRMTRREWDSRSAVWDEIDAGKHGLPLVITVDAAYWPERTAITRAVFSHEKRVRRIAQDTAFAIWLRTIKVPQKIEAGADADTVEDELSGRISVYMNFTDERREEGTEAARIFAEEVQRVGKLLPRDIRSMLFGYDVDVIPRLLAEG